MTLHRSRAAVVSSHGKGVPELIAATEQSGVHLVACTMTMDLMGIK